MRHLSLILLFLKATTVLAAEAPFPLWDTHESVADYAKRTNLPPTKTLDLGNGVKLELVLIPAGKFIMGTPEPTPVDEPLFRRKIRTGQVLLGACSGMLLIILIVVVVRAIRQRRRPQVSLRLLMLVTLAMGGGVLSALHWRYSLGALDLAWLEYSENLFRYEHADREEKPAHAVTITTPFYLGKYHVTQAQYQQAMGTNPSRFNGHHDFPVEEVSWHDARNFCKELSKSGLSIRLPTEAEWEFACRAGTTSFYYTGDDESDLERAAIVDFKSSYAVGQKEPNAFGLYDMHGNVWQWCQDGYEPYQPRAAVDPKGDDSANSRVLRGGSWDFHAGQFRSAYRYKCLPDGRIYNAGFRIAMDLSTPDWPHQNPK